MSQNDKTQWSRRCDELERVDPYRADGRCGWNSCFIVSCRILKIVLGGCLGVLAGVPLIAIGLREQGAALAIMGSLIGVAMVLSSMLYKTTVAATLWRSVWGTFVVWGAMCVNKVPVPGARRIALEVMGLLPSQDPPLRNERRRPGRIKCAPFLIRAGVAVGACVGATAGVVLGLEPWRQQVGGPGVKHLVGMVMLFAVCGAMWGSALALLIVPGRHRAMILMAFVTGGVLGVAFGLSVYRTAALSPLHCFACAIAISVAACLTVCLESREMVGIE